MVDSNGGGSRVPRMVLGNSLRVARTKAGLSAETAAAELDMSVSKLYRIENGHTSTRLITVDAMCRLYEVDREMSEVLSGLAKETRSRGWWHAYGEVIPSWFEVYVDLEQSASVIRTFEPSLVPGLLQVREYATAVIHAGQPDLSGDEVEKRIDLRQNRQRLLTRSFPQPPRIVAVVAEAALLAEPQPTGVMRRQVWHLLEATQLPNVTVQVLPLASAPHRASVAGAFTLLDFAEANGSAPLSIAYSENLTGAVYLDKPSEIETYNDAFHGLADKALDQADTVELLSKILKELNDRESQ